MKNSEVKVANLTPAREWTWRNDFDLATHLILRILLDDPCIESMGTLVMVEKGK
jgi:hypothetical protein